MGIRPGIVRVRRQHAGVMLVELLAHQAPADPRSSREANDLIRSRRVQVDGNVCVDPARVLRAGEVIKVLAHAVAPAARQEDVRLLYVDDDVVVIEKPPGVTTMREGGGSRAAAGRRNRQGTLDELVARLIQEGGVADPGGGKVQRRSRSKGKSKRSGSGLPSADPRHARLADLSHGAPSARKKARVLPVHRLDRDTSGLMVFARTAEAQHALDGQFKARGVGRSYLAVVHGHPQAMTITTHIVRDRGDGLRGSAEVWGKDPAAGQRAVTHIEPLEKIGRYWLIRCTLETGRTHQIRIHLSEIGHMLCGEKEYVRRPDGARMRDESGAPRHALHAARLELVHPTSGRQMRFTSALPRDLAKWLEAERTVRTSKPGHEE